jgi:hypothetical protein
MDCRICRLPADDRLHVTPFGTVRLCEGHGNDLVREMDQRREVAQLLAAGHDVQIPRGDTIAAVLTSCRYGPYRDEAPDA